MTIVIIHTNEIVQKLKVCLKEELGDLYTLETLVGSEKEPFNRVKIDRFSDKSLWVIVSRALDDLSSHLVCWRRYDYSYLDAIDRHLVNIDMNMVSFAEHSLLERNGKYYKADAIVPKFVHLLEKLTLEKLRDCMPLGPYDLMHYERKGSMVIGYITGDYRIEEWHRLVNEKVIEPGFKVV